MQTATYISKRPFIRGIVLAGVLLALVCIGVSLSLSPSLLTTEGLFTSSISVASLLIYAGAAIALTKSTNQPLLYALWLGTVVGGLIVVVEIMNISVETFSNFTDQTMAITTLAFMIAIFLLFGLAGSQGTQHTGTIRFGLLASVWSSVVGILLAILFGFVVNFFFQDRLAAILNHSLDMVRSGITDPYVFTRYNTLESAATHLLEGPVLALIFGTLGALLTKGSQRILSRRNR